MIILGFALKFLGPALRVAALVAAPVVAVLAWGAVEQGLDKRKNDAGEALTGP